jgi:hypothetical protein
VKGPNPCASGYISTTHQSFLYCTLSPAIHFNGSNGTAYTRPSKVQNIFKFNFTSNKTLQNFQNVHRNSWKFPQQLNNNTFIPSTCIASYLLIRSFILFLIFLHICPSTWRAGGGGTGADSYVQTRPFSILRTLLYPSVVRVPLVHMSLNILHLRTSLPVHMSFCLSVLRLSIPLVRYHSGGSMKLNACILLLAHMVYL